MEHNAEDTAGWVAPPPGQSGFDISKYKSKGIYSRDGVQISSLDKEELLNFIVDMLHEDGYRIIESQDQYNQEYGLAND